MKNNQKGVTLVALTITIIVLIILAGITIQTGKEAIRKANLEGLKTNMLLIKTKAKEYVENASFKLGVNPDVNTIYEKAKENLEGEDKGTIVVSGDSIEQKLLNIGISQEDINKGKVYKLSTSNLEKMGLNNVESDDENGWYIIVYDIENVETEIYNTMGFNGKYSLTEIEQIEI